MNEAETFRETFEAEEITAQDPEFLVSQGEHCGYRWVVSHNGRGFRQGYIRLPQGHPWFRKDPYEIEADVHGGLNWSGLSLAGNYWLGFDAEHAFDRYDPALPMPDFIRQVNEALVAIRVRRDLPYIMRSQEYMEGQCRALCDQAAGAMESIEPRKEDRE
jgi:hypothetical protein